MWENWCSKGGSFMLEEIAQEVAISTSEIIGKKVIITNDKSIIIGASNLARLGTFHEASVNIIRTGKPNPDNLDIEKLTGTKSGFALAIILLGKTIGSIGITGKKEEVRRYCYLLKEYLETMLYQKMYMNSALLKEQAVFSFIQDIVAFDEDKNNEAFLLSRGFELGYDLKPPHAAIIIDIIHLAMLEKETATEIQSQLIHRKIKQEIKIVFNNPNDLIAPLPDNKFVIFIDIPSNMFTPLELKEKCKEMSSNLLQMGVSVNIGVGSPAQNLKGLKLSYEDAWSALILGSKTTTRYPTVFYIDDFLLENFVSNVDKDLGERLISRHLTKLKEQNDWIDLSKTICAWCEAGFNRKEASEVLFIHRNTLDYRLNKIREITNIDLKDYKKIMLIYLTIMKDLLNQ